MLYLSRIKLQNVRCFQKLDLELSPRGLPPGWTVFVGDNASGKSTLLRSIAMGICDEASAAGLLKESDEGYIRRGESEAQIILSLHDPLAPEVDYRIQTKVLRERKRRGIFADRVIQTTIPPGASFPWDEVFVSGYGAGRGVSGAGDISSYSAIDAVYNMFNYTEGLQNPQLIIRRILARDSLAPTTDRQIFQILCAATGASQIRLTSEGIRVDGPWGEGMPLRDLADGYRSAFLWLADLIGWALTFKPRSRSTEGIRGVVLVDELEQHLHARWQRTVVDDLRNLFPNTQFIVSTHSPLVASSVGPRVDTDNRDRLYVLETMGDNAVEASPHEFMRGWRMDQVLASRAFKYQIGSDPEIERALREGSKLAAKEVRTPKEEAAYQELRTLLSNTFYSKTSPIEREAEEEAQQRLRDEIKHLEERLFGEEQK